MNFNKELETAILAAKEASKLILEVYNTNFEFELKDDNSPVTRADLASDKKIREILLSSFPNYGILTEESKTNNNRIEKDYCFIVDPLDGTKDYVNRTNNFAINIALSYKHEIVMGVIYVPVRDIMYYATKGNGAYKIENGVVSRIHVSSKTSDVTMLTSLFFFHEQDKYKSLDFIKEMIPIGSSYKAGLIAEGKAEFCIKNDDRTKEWDTAPSEIIIREAGGIMTNRYGTPISYNKEDVVNRDGFLICNNQEIFKKIVNK